MVYSVKFKAFVLIGFVLVCLTACGPLDVKPEDWPTDRIERITGVRLPEFSVIKYVYGHADFFGEYKDTLYIEFESIPSDTLTLPWWSSISFILFIFVRMKSV